MSESHRGPGQHPNPSTPVTSGGETLDATIVEADRISPFVFHEDLGERGTACGSDRERLFDRRPVDDLLVWLLLAAHRVNVTDGR